MSWQPPPPPPGPGKGAGPVPAVAPKQPLTYYQILQVDPAAHPTIIRYAYRFLAAMYHPDNGDTGNTEKFKTITEAWRILSDSAKRAAYDVQMGVKSASSGPVDTGSSQPKASRVSLSWSEIELRLAVLQVLMEARRKKPQTGGASARMLMDCLNVQMSDMEYVLWYLREKGYITRTESTFLITIQGVDYLIDQLSKIQPMDAGSTSASVASVNLPAAL